MAKAKTTAELTAENIDQALTITHLTTQINEIWVLLRRHMDGDGRVDRAMWRANADGCCVESDEG